MLGDGTSLLECLVVDAGPLIRNMKFDRLTSRVVTTPGVMLEIRDEATRQRYEVAP